MNTLEQRLYIQYSKSAVKSFESFVDGLLKHEDVPSDAELISSMQRISKKMQTMMNKWDVKLAKLSPIEKNLSNPSLDLVTNGTHASSDEVVCFKNPRPRSITPLEEVDPKPGCSYISNTNYDQEKNTMMVFKDIDENLIIGTEGFYVEEVTTGFWRCKMCEANNLPLNNLIAHIKGKLHKKKISTKNV